jgi:acyl-homoserine lactone synthase
MLRLVQLHFRVTPLGIPMETGKDSIVAVTAAFDSRTLARLRHVRGDSRPAIVAQPMAERRMSA